MACLIDGDKLLKDLYVPFCYTDDDNLGWAYLKVEKAVREQSSIDAVEVVRCKDCEHYCDDEWCDINEAYFEEDDFCSYGKRKEETE